MDEAPIGVLALAPDGVIRAVNEAALSIFGYAEEALLGQHLDMLLPQELQPGHTAHSAWFFASSAAQDKGESWKASGRRVDGRRVPVEIRLGSTGSGDGTRTIAFITDMSRCSQPGALFEAIIAALPIALVMTDAAGTIELTNRMLETMFGYGPQALMGQQLDILLLPRQAELPEGKLKAPRFRAMREGREAIGRRRSGKEFPVEIALSEIQHESCTSFLALITDISIHKKLEHALEQANANLEEFTYIASHDLRSPLRGIADLLEWIKEDLDPSQVTPTIEANFGRAKQRISRSERMIEDLLTYAQASTHSTRQEMVNPRALLEEVLESANIPEGFEVTIEAEQGSFVTHKTPLQTALRNLLDNAVKHHGGSSGRIRCSVREASQYYVFAVDDDGQGVPRLERERIFKLFHRASSKAEGHGIGLSVTRRMVASHGGKLVLEDRSVLGGASFAIYWPQIEARDDE